MIFTRNMLNTGDFTMHFIISDRSGSKDVLTDTNRSGHLWDVPYLFDECNIFFSDLKNLFFFFKS